MSVFFAGVLGSIATLGRNFVGRCRGWGGADGGGCETYGLVLFWTQIPTFEVGIDCSVVLFDCWFFRARMSRWWFQIFSIFTSIWGNMPI